MIKLERIAHNDKQTIGTLKVPENEGGYFSCRVIELPPLDNKNNISRIPSGIYPLVKMDGDKLKWSRFSYPHFWIQDVPGRSGIKVHISNYFFQIKGCVAVGSHFTDINEDGYLDVANSTETLNKLIDILPNKTKIEIIDESKPTKVEIAGLINETKDVDLQEIDLFPDH